MGNAARSLLLLALLAALFGCSHTVRRPLHVESKESRDPVRTRGGVEIVGYTTSDGTSHRYFGRARITGDSLQFLSRDDVPVWDSVARQPKDDPELLWVPSPPDVAILHVSRVSYWKMGLALLIPVAYIVFIFAVGLAEGPS